MNMVIFVRDLGVKKKYENLKKNDKLKTVLGYKKTEF